MGSILNMKSISWVALVLIVAWLVLQLNTPEPWWSYIAIFLAFMTVFCHLSSLYIKKVSNAASRKLDFIALIVGVMFIVSAVVLLIVKL